MKLFIKVKDGEPFEHPIFEENLVQAFPDIDTEKLPPEFARFIRVPQPQTNRFEVYEGVTYEWNGWAFTDVHHVRAMSVAEKKQVIDKLKLRKPYESWVWSEENIRWEPPKRPTIGGPWRRDPASLDWVIAKSPPYPSWIVSEDGTHYTAPIPKPQDGNGYRWDEPTLSWVLVDV
jgi:hypothetical protein